MHSQIHVTLFSTYLLNNKNYKCFLTICFYRPCFEKEENENTYFTVCYKTEPGKVEKVFNDHILPVNDNVPKILVLIIHIFLAKPLSKSSMEVLKTASSFGTASAVQYTKMIQFLQ